MSNYNEYMVLTATVHDWTIEEGEKVVAGTTCHDTMVVGDRALELLEGGRIWLTKWRSVEYSWPTSLGAEQ